MLLSFSLLGVLWEASWKPFRASGRPLGGVWGVFWRPFGGPREASGGSLGRLGDILGALSLKIPSRISEEGPKSSPRRPQEAPRGPRRPPKGSQGSLKKDQEATQTTPQNHIQVNNKENIKNHNLLDENQRFGGAPTQKWQ